MSFLSSVVSRVGFALPPDPHSDLSVLCLALLGELFVPQSSLSRGFRECKSTGMSQQVPEGLVVLSTPSLPPALRTGTPTPGAAMVKRKATSEESAAKDEKKRCVDRL